MWGLQWRIQDFPKRGAQTPNLELLCKFFAENCMKMKEFGPPGGRIPGDPPPPLDPPMVLAVSYGFVHVLFVLTNKCGELPVARIPFVSN